MGEQGPARACEILEFRTVCYELSWLLLPTCGFKEALVRLGEPGAVLMVGEAIGEISIR